MPPSFLNRPVDLLTATGSFEPVVEGAAWRRPCVVLARELCSFEFYTPSAGVGVAGLAAARLHARSAAPFGNAGWLVRRGGGGYGVWWWDKARIDPWLQDRFGQAPVQVFPETLAQQPGDGWRIVRSGQGFEAQHWKDGALVSSAWQRRPFDAESWTAFARMQRNPAEPPPDLPPPATRSPLTGAPSAAFELEALSPETIPRVAALAGVIAVVALTTFWMGQGLRLRALAEADGREAARLRASSPASSTSQDRSAALRIAAFRRLSDRPDMLAALGTALGIARLYGAEPESFDIDSASLTLTMPYSAMSSIDRIAAEMEASRQFADPRPTTDPATGTIQLRMRLVAQRPGQGG
ncbi:MAG: hypothetical protein WDM92_05675 [Caulobacteraceae bacterium]